MKIKGKFKGLDYQIQKDGALEEEKKKVDPADAYFSGTACPQCNSFNIKQNPHERMALSRSFTCTECNCLFTVEAKGLQIEKEPSELTTEEKEEKFGQRVTLVAFIWFILFVFSVIGVCLEVENHILDLIFTVMLCISGGIAILFFIIVLFVAIFEDISEGGKFK